METKYMSNEQIQQAAPSAFAGQPYHNRSSRYAFVPTIDVIEGMRQAGFMPHRVRQAKGGPKCSHLHNTISL